MRETANKDFASDSVRGDRHLNFLRVFYGTYDILFLTLDLLQRYNELKFLVIW